MSAISYPIIGIAGRARVGKDTCADFLVRYLGGYRYGFADPLKRMLIPLGIDMTDPFWAENKEKEIPLFGRSLRYLMQTLGTEWGRELVHPDIWVKLAECTLFSTGERMIISDVRFDNEAEFIRSKGGVILHVSRIDAPPVAGHASEAGIRQSPLDLYVLNDGTIDELYTKLAALFDGQ